MIRFIRNRRESEPWKGSEPRIGCHENRQRYPSLKDKSLYNMYNMSILVLGMKALLD